MTEIGTTTLRWLSSPTNASGLRSRLLNAFRTRVGKSHGHTIGRWILIWPGRIWPGRVRPGRIRQSRAGNLERFVSERE